MRRRCTRNTAAFLFAVALASPLLAQTPLSEMVSIPAGPFTMGTKEGPQDEQPQHEVTLAAYSIDRYPVTNAQYAEYLSAVFAAPATSARLYDFNDPDARIHRRGERWLADAGYENHPVVEVPWGGALAYCVWRGKRLPTEAEWEKAARGTDARRYPWGSDLPDRRRAQYEARYNETAPVDAFPAGASLYGARDMAGNAWEWVSSAYRPYPYRADDGREDLKTGAVRGTRGGGHDSPASEITTTHRGRDLSRNPASGHHNIGFRCARKANNYWGKGVTEGNRGRFPSVRGAARPEPSGERRPYRRAALSTPFTSRTEPSTPRSWSMFWTSSVKRIRAM